MERPPLSALPVTPGVYLYKDANGKIIYVGKAVNLRKRVLSYFRPVETLPAKTAAMLRHAASLDTLSTGTEKEALLLEASLIKKHRPHYNIVLRDDKQYVLFRVARNVSFPRLEVVRSVKKDGARYFGPFTSATAARETFKTLHRAFPLRRCTDRAFANRVRPCLYHHLNQCLAPCTEAVEPSAYAAIIQRVEMLLSGRSHELVDQLTRAMREASDAMDYEAAAALRDQIKAIRQTVEKQNVVLADRSDMDVIGIAPTSAGLALGLLFVRQGCLVDGRTFFWSGLDLHDGPELLRHFLVQYYGSGATPPPRIVVPWLPGQAGESDDPDESNPPGGATRNDPDDEDALDSASAETDSLEALLADVRGGTVRIAAPRQSAEERLVDMACTNALESARRREETPMADRLAVCFRADTPLKRVECVDVSHTGGQSTRMAMVVFEDGHPLPSAYRTYTLRDADGAGDDYAALAEWARRRLADGPPWADLVLIDGGRGQIAAVRRALLDAAPAAGLTCASEIGGDPLPFVLAGIAKARNEKGQADRRAGNVGDRIFLPGRTNPLALKDGSVELLFLQHVRDTAHHYVLGRHRKARSGSALAAELLRVPGIGQATARLLWQHFPSLEAMIAAAPEELAAIPGIGPRKARNLAQKLAALKG